MPQGCRPCRFAGTRWRIGQRIAVTLCLCAPVLFFGRWVRSESPSASDRDLYRQLADPTTSVREAAFEGIAALGPSQADSLRALVSAPDAPLLARREAIRLLVRLEVRAAVPDLLERVADSAEFRVLRGEAVRALGALGDGSVVAPLLAALPELPGAVSAAFVSLGRDETLPALFDALRVQARRRQTLRARVRELQTGVKPGEVEGAHDHGHESEGVHEDEVAHDAQEPQGEEPSESQSDPEDEIAAIGLEMDRSRYATIELAWAICRLGCESGIVGIAGRAQNSLGRFPADGLIRGMGYPNPSRLEAFRRFREVGGEDPLFSAIPESAAADWKSHQDFGAYGRALNWWEAGKHRFEMVGGKANPSPDLRDQFRRWIGELRPEVETEPEGFLILMREIAFPDLFAELSRHEPGSPETTALLRVLYAAPKAVAEYARERIDVGSEREAIHGLGILSALRDGRGIPMVREFVFGEADSGGGPGEGPKGRTTRSNELRIAGVDYLTVLRDHSSLDRFVALLEVVKGDRDLLRAVCRAIGSLADEEDVEARDRLASLLSAGASTWVRLSAASALVDQADARGVEPLLTGLDNDDVEVREFSVGRLRDLSGIYLGFEAGGLAETRAAVSGAWRRWWESSRTAGFEIDRERLLALHYQRFPMQALAYLTAEKAVRGFQEFGGLVRTLGQPMDRPWGQRVAILNAGAGRWVVDVVQCQDGSRSNPGHLLLQRRDDPDPLVRLGIVGALALCASPDWIPDLVGYLGDGFRLVRVSAAEGLTETARFAPLSVESRVGLLRVLRDRCSSEKDLWVRVKLIEARLALGEGEGLVLLLEAMELPGSGAAWLRDEAFEVFRNAVGQDFGYRALAGSAKRAEAVARIREWWVEAAVDFVPRRVR